MTPTAPKRLVIVGASGMVGGHALRYVLENPSVSGVTAIGRRKLGISDPKLSEVLHQDFADWSALAEALSDHDAAVFTGVVPDAELRTITVDYTVEFARVLRGRSRCDGAGENAVNVRDGGCSVSLRGNALRRANLPVVCCRSVAPTCLSPNKSRTWSRALTTITRPRSTSTEASRGQVSVPGVASMTIARWRSPTAIRASG